MPRYDEPTSLFDAPGMFYDTALSVLERKKMAKVRTGAWKMAVAELIATVRNVITQMTGNANVPNPNPTLVDLGAAADAAEAKVQAVLQKKAELDQAMLERDTAQAALVAAFEQEAAYVQNATGGDEAQILSTGFSVRGASTPTGPVGQVQNVVLTEGDNPGTLDCQFDPVNNRNSYEAQLTTVDPVNGPYTQVATPTASKALLTGQTSGQRVWVRVRAIGAAGPGPWSDPATKIVP